MPSHNSQVRVKHHQWTRETCVMVIELDDGRRQVYNNITEVQYMDLVVNMPPSMFLPRMRNCIDNWMEKYHLVDSSQPQQQKQIAEKGLMIDV